MDEVEHSNHKLINLDQLRDELTKINHPIRKVLKIASSEQLLLEIDLKSNNIMAQFKSNLDDTVRNLKKQINQFAQESLELKQTHDYLFSYQKQKFKHYDLFQGLHKLNTIYLSNFLNQVANKSLDENVKNLFQSKVNRKEEKQITTHHEKKMLPKKFKNTTKSEAELIKQLLSQTGHGITELEIDLLGQMVNRQELLMPNKVFQTIKKFQNLQILKLSLSSTGLQDLGDLSKTLIGLQGLTTLSLAMGNTKVHYVHDLGKALSYLRHLEILELYFWSSNVSDITEIGKALGSMKKLISLEIQLGNTFVSDIQDVGKGISENKILRKFSMNLEFTKVQDISELGQALYGMKNIEEFELHLIDTLVHPRIRKNFSNVILFQNEWKLLNKNPASHHKHR